MQRKLYVRAGVVVGASWVGSKDVVIAVAQPDAEVFEVEATSPIDIGWVRVEGGGPADFQPPAPVPPTIGPNEFYFLWTMPEQVAIEAIRQSDAGVKLFMRRLDDPRTTEVVLADPAVQAAVRHTVEQLVAVGVIEEADIEARVAAIIAGPAR